MADNMKGLKRTHYCGDFSSANIGEIVTVSGFVQKCRELGALVFIDLRDRTGIVQLAFNDETQRDIFEKAAACRAEYVLMAQGKVRARESANSELKTGEIEIAVSDLRLLSKAVTPPFEIVEKSNVKEELRLKHRYLDLRRPNLQHNMAMRHKVTKLIRDYFDKNGFIEIETPILIKSTPEGARDFLVPSRLHKGSFYALPQSPQLYKQLSMVAGFDRYIQIARCFRDEDLRYDRQPEFTQIDMEMSYVDIDDVLDMNEGMIAYVFKQALGVDIPLPLPRMTYADAMERFGSDKPDTRFGMELVNINDTVKDCGFSVFADCVASGGRVSAINVKGAASTFTRKEIDKLTEFVKGFGVKGLAWIRHTDDGISSSFAKFMTEEEMNALTSAMECKQGDVILIIAAKTALTLSALGALRLNCAKKLDIIPKQLNFLWITEFPFFEWDEDLGDFVAKHHAFTSPMEDDIALLDSDKGSVRAMAYDLVLNGVELSSGSIRITDPDLQKRMFYALGLSNEEAEEKFGFLTDAFKHGAPPHGGMGIGLDRLLMLMLDTDNVRDVIAFPKVQNMSELMTSCPSPCANAQLEELGIKLIEE